MILHTSKRDTFAFVEFATCQAAAKAICDGDGRLIEGFRWNVTYFESQKERYGSLNRVWSERNVVLYALPRETNERLLETVCKQFGAIQSLRVKTRQGNVTGFVCFETIEGVAKALQGPIVVLGVKVRAAKWVPKEVCGDKENTQQSACLYID